MILRDYPDAKEYARLAQSHNVVPLAREILADLETPVSLLARFMPREGPVFLFESVEGDARWGRYSIMGVRSRAHLRVFRDRVDVAHRDGSAEQIGHGGDPLNALRVFLGRYRMPELPEMPRFHGGLAGVLGYEMVSLFEPKVANSLPPEVPLAEFVMPDELLVFDNVRHSLTLLTLNFLEAGTDVATSYREGRARLDALMAGMDGPLPVENSGEEDRDLRLRATMAPEDFRAMVRKVQEQILEGEVIQTVISQTFACDAPRDLLGLYRAQRYVNPSPYMFFMRLGETTLVGSSPETMVRLDHRVACLRPIAGTRPRGREERADRALADELLRDEKERAEHLMLVDLGRNELGRVAVTGSVQVTELMVVERYSHVMHLVSNILADLDEGYDGFDLLRAAFPAGTLSGAPKVRAMQLISEIERTPRGPYGGAVGYLAFNGDLDFAICIRTAIVEGDRMTVRAGAGIVADSDPEAERIETVNKARSIEKALELLGSRREARSGGECA